MKFLKIQRQKKLFQDRKLVLGVFQPETIFCIRNTELYSFLKKRKETEGEKKLG